MAYICNMCSVVRAARYVPRGSTGLSKHGDPVFPHFCPLNQNLARVWTIQPVDTLRCLPPAARDPSPVRTPDSIPSSLCFSAVSLRSMAPGLCFVAAVLGLLLAAPARTRAAPDAANTTGPRCMISSIGRDGLGHRVVSDLSCIAVAQELGLTFVWRPWIVLEHLGRAAAGLQAFLGFYDAFPRWNATVMRPWPRKPLPYVGHCKESGWLDAIADGRGQCAADGRRVYDADNCWDRFWCRTIFTPAWAQVMPTIQRGLGRYLRAPAAYGARDIHVVLHLRHGADAGERRMGEPYFQRVMNAIVARHAAYTRRHPRVALGVRFWAHTDSAKPLQLDAGPHELTVVYTRAAETKATLRQMVFADVLVASVSSFSDMAALLGGMTVLYPTCKKQHELLPEWHAVKCSGPVSLEALCWPPTRRSNTTDTRRTRIADVDCPGLTE